jgi:hypothetical protein
MAAEGALHEAEWRETLKPGLVFGPLQAWIPRNLLKVKGDVPAGC